MTSHPRRKDWEVLGLDPGAELAQVKRAYRYRRSLYDPVALATYMLIEEDERARMLARIDEAFRRIAKAEPPLPQGSTVSSDSPCRHPAVPSGPPPDPDTLPGQHLRHHRLNTGLSLEQIAVETKVRAAFLEQVENEDFESLPAQVFVRGYVLQFARAVGLSEPEEFADLYLEKMKRDRSEG